MGQHDKPAALDLDTVRSLAEIVGPDHVVTDPEVLVTFGTDWTGRFVGHPPLAVRPGSTAEVAAVVAWCRSAGRALVPQGGNTGLVGGGVPLEGEIVLSLRRLRALEPVEPSGGQVTAGAGVTLAELQRAATAAGWVYGVDLSARESATVGGGVATNAGGLHLLRYGDTRAQLLGVEAVLGTGAVVSHLGGLLKDNTGYALPALLCGSEGTLGVVTAARLRLVPPAPERVVALVAFVSVTAAVEAAQTLRRQLAVLEAAELFLADGLALVCRVSSLADPFGRPRPAYLLVEAASAADPLPDLAAAVDGLAGMADVAVATDPARRAELWRYREDHTTAVNTLGAPHKLDVTLPAPALAEFVVAIPGVVAAAAPGASIWLWGHAADGNVHVNITGVAPDDERVDAVVLERVAAWGGSISAEHGIGRAKRRWLHLNRSADEIDIFRAIKRALDPDGVLNPNVLLPPPAADEAGS